MAIPKSAHVDNLDVSTLRGPLLDEYYGSAIQKADVGAVANEIMRRHMAKLPTDTGKLKSTAKVTYHRSAQHRDGRWEAEYSVGGPSADYIVPLEDEHHYLDAVLNEMGFFVGDVVNGPTGRIPKADQAPAPRVNDEREAGLGSASTGRRIVDAYRGYYAETGSDIMDLAELDRRLGSGVSREERDAALRELAGSQGGLLMPEEDQKTLTDERRAAGIQYGAKEQHTLYVREDYEPGD